MRPHPTLHSRQCTPLSHGLLEAEGVLLGVIFGDATPMQISLPYIAVRPSSHIIRSRRSYISTTYCEGPVSSSSRLPSRSLLTKRPRALPPYIPLFS